MSINHWFSGQEPQARDIREKKIAAGVKGRVLFMDRTHDVLSRQRILKTYSRVIEHVLIAWLSPGNPT